MFTGLIADVGVIRRILPGDRTSTLTVQTTLAKPDLRVGDSVAVSGACLTVVTVGDGQASLTAVAETLGRTTLGDLRVGDRVNLERPLRLGDRLDGHLVLGHVDGIGRLEERRREGDAWRFFFSCLPDLQIGLVPKGSVAVDGVSLTLAAVGGPGFEIAVIPHTLQATTLADLQKGARVNLEVDIIGKYVAKMLGAYRGGDEGLSLQKLADWGYR